VYGHRLGCEVGFVFGGLGTMGCIQSVRREVDSEYVCQIRALLSCMVIPNYSDLPEMMKTPDVIVAEMLVNEDFGFY